MGGCVVVVRRDWMCVCLVGDVVWWKRCGASSQPHDGRGDGARQTQIDSVSTVERTSLYVAWR
jgi:hypothetical protein